MEPRGGASDIEGKATRVGSEGVSNAVRSRWSLITSLRLSGSPLARQPAREDFRSNFSEGGFLIETRSHPRLLAPTLVTYVDHSHGPVLAPAT
jgi:hypothetical protein